MDKKEFRMLVKEQRKRALKKDIVMDLLLLLLPSLLLSCVFFLALYSFVLSFFAVYFILPMFYAVERRIRYRLTGIGKPDFSYKDGYLAFFRERKGGIFGAISTFFLSFSLLLLSYVIFFQVLPNVVNAYPESVGVYSKLMEMINDPYENMGNVTTYFFENMDALEQPLSIFASVCFFLPVFVFLFCSVPMNLTYHQLATIVLPDIDKNISASQARSLAKNGFGRSLAFKEVSYHFAYNWPYMIAFTLLYAGSTYLTSLITTANSSLVPLLCLITPTLAVFYGLFLQYAVLINDYSIIEVLSRTLPDRIPEAMKLYISQAYQNPNYIHGEESSARGSFFPEPKRYEENRPETKEPEVPDESAHGVVIDFSKKEDDQ